MALYVCLAVLVSLGGHLTNFHHALPAAVCHAPREARVLVEGPCGELCTRLPCGDMVAFTLLSQIGGYWEDKTPASDKPF